jgi:hypothetical protein
MHTVIASQYYRNIPDFRETSDACKAQAAGLLHAAHASLATRDGGGCAPANADDDAEEKAWEDMSACLEATLERLDSALDAAREATDSYKRGGWAAPPPGRRADLFLSGGAAGQPRGAARCVPRVQRHVAGLARPQASFPDRIDNMAPWTPAVHAHLAPRLQAAAAAPGVPAASSNSHSDALLAAHAARLAAAAGACAGASSSSGGGGRGVSAPAVTTTTTTTPHPFATELAALRYASWQLAAPEQPESAPIGPDAAPLTVVDTHGALDDMLAALAGERQLALDLEHHSYRCAVCRHDVRECAYVMMHQITQPPVQDDAQQGALGTACTPGSVLENYSRPPPPKCQWCPAANR